MFTKKYIEMVTQADEIQKLWKQKVGDWVVDYNYMTPTLLDKKIEGINKPITVIGWLPTLEDLFGMLDKRNLGETLYFLGDEVNDVNDLCEKTLDWVMLVNYNKSWNPEKKEWEEINGS